MKLPSKSEQDFKNIKTILVSPRIIRLLCTDPGLTNFGWSLLEYNLATGHTTVIKCGTITGKSLVKQQTQMQAQFEKRHIVVWELEKVIQSMIIEFKPDYVVSENAFSHRFPQAYAALVMVIQAVRTATMRAMGQDIHLIAPKESKKVASLTGTADKEKVQDGIAHNENLTIRTARNSNQPPEMTEHAWDSIAAGMAFIQNYLPSLMACESLKFT